MKAKSDIQKWAEKMRKVGEFKERERKKWLRNLTFPQRMKIAEDLLSTLDLMPRRNFPSPPFVALSVLLEKRNGGK